MFTNGTLFDDLNHKITIKEGGAFVSFQKINGEKLKITGSIGYDKNRILRPLNTRASVVYTLAEITISGLHTRPDFAIPHLVISILSSMPDLYHIRRSPDNSKGMNVYENTLPPHHWVLSSGHLVLR